MCKYTKENKIMIHTKIKCLTRVNSVKYSITKDVKIRVDIHSYIVYTILNIGSSQLYPILLAITKIITKAF